MVAARLHLFPLNALAQSVFLQVVLVHDALKDSRPSTRNACGQCSGAIVHAVRADAWLQGQMCGPNSS